MSDTSRQFEKAGHPAKTDAKTDGEHSWAQISRDVLLGAAFPAALAAEKAGEYAANHPDQLQKASAWVKDEMQGLLKDYTSGINLGTLLFPELTLMNKLEEKAKECQKPAESVKSTLTPAEMDTAKRIEANILGGDLKALENEMHSFHGRAGDLSKVMRQVSQELDKHGLLVWFEHGQTMMGGEKKFHDEGHVTICSKKGGTALEVDTDPRLSSNLGGPVQKQKDGSYTDLLMGLPGDPAQKLREFAAEAKSHDK